MCTKSLYMQWLEAYVTCTLELQLPVVRHLLKFHSFFSVNRIIRPEIHYFIKTWNSITLSVYLNQIHVSIQPRTVRMFSDKVQAKRTSIIPCQCLSSDGAYSETQQNVKRNAEACYSIRRTDIFRYFMFDRSWLLILGKVRVRLL